jgi:hypothetical protein
MPKRKTCAQQKLAHNKMACEIFGANTGQRFQIFRSRVKLFSRQTHQRHGFVRLSPCFSRALAPVSAESRHEAK